MRAITSISTSNLASQVTPIAVPVGCGGGEDLVLDRQDGVALRLVQTEA